MNFSYITSGQILKYIIKIDALSNSLCALSLFSSLKRCNDKTMNARGLRPNEYCIVALATYLICELNKTLTVYGMNALHYKHLVEHIHSFGENEVNQQ